MRKALRIVVALSLLSVVGLSVASASADEEPNYTICHRTNSNSNPYVVITVDQSAVDGESGGDHYAQHKGPIWDPTLKAQKIKWGDVIPPVPGFHSGLNWDPQTSPAFIANDCATPPVPTHDVTLDKVTTGGTAPADDTDFTFEVLCEPAEEATEFVIAPEDDPVLVGDGIAEDDLCTITETGSSGATAISYEVTGGTVDSTTADSVTFSVDADVTVVATNGYPEPPTGDVTLDKALSGGSAPTDNPSYAFTVACDSGTVTSPANVTPDQGAALVADDVLQGDQCTITETGDFTDHDVTFMVTGGTEVSNTDTSVTFTVSSTDVSVVATNDYASVEGVVIVPKGPAELPRTGAEDQRLFMIGLGLLAMGAGALVAKREVLIRT